ncbi:hypothetical protein INR49_029603 [Caranx melampygus]|nr:hypothetical protein INR49_029603 [Caranx melampygus]
MATVSSSALTGTLGRSDKADGGCCYVLVVLTTVLTGFWSRTHNVRRPTNHLLMTTTEDKHDTEPSHRCMPTQKAQLSAIPSAPWLSSASQRGVVSTGRS